MDCGLCGSCGLGSVLAALAVGSGLIVKSNSQSSLGPTTCLVTSTLPSSMLVTADVTDWPGGWCEGAVAVTVDGAVDVAGLGGLGDRVGGAGHEPVPSPTVGATLVAVLVAVSPSGPV